MLQPSRRKYRKEHKGRNTGLATRGAQVSFGEFGLKATGRGRLTARQIEAPRVDAGAVVVDDVARGVAGARRCRHPGDDEHAAALDEMVATLRPGGWFVIDFLNAAEVRRRIGSGPRPGTAGVVECIVVPGDLSACPEGSAATRERSVVLGHGRRFCLIGERINPTGRRIFQEQLRAAEDLKRVRRPGQDDWLAEPTLSRLEQWTETKTVWHPIGV